MEKLLLVLAVAILSSCGSEHPALETITGTTVKQATVSLKDSTGAEITTESDGAGNYQLDTTGLKKPFQLKATYSNSSSHFAVATEAGVTNISQYLTTLLSIASGGLNLVELFINFKIELFLLIVQMLDWLNLII